MMRDRDKRILDSLERFRCLSRDDLINLHFGNVKNGAKAANHVLRRLRDRSEIEVISTVPQFVYARNPSPIKKDSLKIPHYLAIAGVYRNMIEIGSVTRWFQVEPKYGKGMPEPDIFAIWGGMYLWIEVQRNAFSSKIWNEKLARYSTLRRTELIWRQEAWQPKDKCVWPLIVIISETNILLPKNLGFLVIQVRKISDLVRIIVNLKDKNVHKPIF